MNSDIELSFLNFLEEICQIKFLQDPEQFDKMHIDRLLLFKAILASYQGDRVEVERLVSEMQTTIRL
jgi:hypothetical protein